MARAETDKFLGANVPETLVDKFWASAFPPGLKVSKIEIVIAMAEAWLSLPDAAKEHYLHHDKKQESLQSLIRETVKDEVRQLLAQKTKLAKSRTGEAKETIAKTTYKIPSEQQQQQIEQIRKTHAGGEKTTKSKSRCG